MKKSIILTAALCLLGVACSKKNDNGTDKLVMDGVSQENQTSNGLTYRLFTQTGSNQFKGILVMGSGNDENNPAPGALDGAAETALCNKAAKNGYLAAIVQYRKTPGTADWNASAQQICDDYNACINALSAKYGVAKEKSVVGGESYSSYMLLTGTAYYNTLAYCKGVLAPCGSTGEYQAQHFKIPVYSVVCSGNNEGDLAGKALYDAISNPAVKSKSAGVTDNSCNIHCGGSWTDQLYAQMVTWLQ